MDYFNNVLTNFLDLECSSCVAVYAGSLGFNPKYLHLFSEDERRSYGYGMSFIARYVYTSEEFVFVTEASAVQQNDSDRTKNT